MAAIALDLYGGKHEVEGAVTGGGVSVIVIDTDVAGEGPRLHRHPYAETFVLVSGSVRFWVRDENFVATAPSVHGRPGQDRDTGIVPIDGNYPSKGTGERAVWFRDSEGNMLGLGQPVRQAAALPDRQREWRVGGRVGRVDP